MVMFKNRELLVSEEGAGAGWLKGVEEETHIRGFLKKRR
jgi:hypothetical protein